MGLFSFVPSCSGTLEGLHLFCLELYESLRFLPGFTMGCFGFLEGSFSMSSLGPAESKSLEIIEVGLS